MEGSHNILSVEELKNELFSYSDKNILPEKIIESIYTKLIEKNISINSKQLNKLVERFIKEIPNVGVSNIKENNKVDNFEKSSVNDNFKKSENKDENNILLKTLNNIENRIAKLEKTIILNKEIKSNVGPVFYSDSSDENKNFKNNIDIVKLTEIPMDAQSIVILMKWLQYLVNQIGKNKASEALEFYVDIGWISEDIKFDLLKYINGLTDRDMYSDQNCDERKITSKEHINSLLFIQKLKGMDMDDFLLKIDQDLNKFNKTINSFNIIE